MRPKSVDKIIKKYTKAKAPDFFKYAKDKTEKQCEPPNSSVMNRLSAQFKTPHMKYLRRMAKVDYRYMLSDMDFMPTPESKKVLETYDYWNLRQRFVYNTADEVHGNQEDLWAYQQIRQKILESTEEDIDFVVNSLVTLYYTTRNFSQKKMLWACFGDKIVENLKKNTTDLGEICLVCGRRFTPSTPRQLTCRPECGHKLDIINKRLRRSGDMTLGELVRWVGEKEKEN